MEAWSPCGSHPDAAYLSHIPPWCGKWSQHSSRCVLNSQQSGVSGRDWENQGHWRIHTARSTIRVLTVSTSRSLDAGGNRNASHSCNENIHGRLQWGTGYDGENKKLVESRRVWSSRNATIPCRTFSRLVARQPVHQNYSSRRRWWTEQNPERGTVLLPLSHPQGAPLCLLWRRFGPLFHNPADDFVWCTIFPDPARCANLVVHPRV